MAEISRPWSGIVTGDAGPYSDDQWTDTWKTLMAHVVASQGVFIDQLNDLALSGLAASPITIETGRAMVNGIWYESNTNVSVAIPTPAGNPRVDRIVLRADWVLQTVRITRIAGAEAAAPVPPALVQVDGTTWDLPLWQVFITVGGVISIWRDEREFIGQYVPTGATPQRVYMEEEFFMPRSIMLTGDMLNSFLITLVANGTLEQLASLPPSGNFRFNVAAATNSVDVATANTDPGALNLNTAFIAKQPGSHATVDRILGWTDSISLTPTNGIYFRADGAGNWFAVTRAGGVETATDTGQALDDVWRRFEFRITSTNVVVFLIDGVVVATHQTNIPAAGMQLRMSLFDDGTGTQVGNFMQVQYCKAHGDR